jgi:hypothetical protein
MASLTTSRSTLQTAIARGCTLTMAALITLAVGLPASGPHPVAGSQSLSASARQIGVRPALTSMTTATANVTAATVAKRAAHSWRIQVRGWRKSFKRGGQGRIDRCKATLWWGSVPNRDNRPAWLAGHNTCGFWRWDRWLPVGSKFRVLTPRGKLWKYRVYDRGFINRRSGPSTGLIHGDLTLQTCRGSGMTFVYARRVGQG